MPYITFIALVILAVGSAFSVYRQLQTLQQNSYFLSGYFKWVSGSYTIELALSALAYCAITFLVLKGRSIATLIIAILILLARLVFNIKIRKESAKKLVFTARVKRLYIAALVVLGITLYGSIYSFYNIYGEISRVLCVALSVVSPLLTLAIWLLTYPIEKVIAARCINDAKRILKEHKNLTVIGITGSCGKTTTQFILNRILSKKYNTVCTTKSFNTPTGVARAICKSIKPHTQMFVCAMGAKNIGGIKEICDIANPDYAIITSVDEQRSETFKSVDDVFKTKFELADAVAKKGGVTLANLDSLAIKERSQTRSDLIYFGEGTKYYATNIVCGEDNTTFELCLDDTSFTVSTCFFELHSVSNIVAAAAVAHILGVSDDDIKSAIDSLEKLNID